MTTQQEDDQSGPPPRYRALVGLLLLAGLVAAVLFAVHELQSAARLQDCVASGRTNCAPIDTTSHRQ
jgi:hypothetical protein